MIEGFEFRFGFSDDNSSRITTPRRAYKFLRFQDHSLIILFKINFLFCDFKRALGSIRSFKLIC
mgnify:CR=1 FL=1